MCIENTEVSPAPSDPTDPILVDVTFSREKGKCLLRVNARTLHAYLDAIGVTRGPIAGSPGYQYADRPADSARVVNTSAHTVSTTAILTANQEDGTAVYNLMDWYSSPPPASALQNLADSVEDAVTRIIEHYRPVEITVRILGGK